MSIKYQTEFWQRNVNEFSSADGKYELPTDGFREFSKLLKTIFSDYRSYEISTAESVKTKIGIAADDLENYHNLTNTVECLYYIAACGTLREESGGSFLEVNKAAFKTEFKASATFPMEKLGDYGFYFEFQKMGQEVSDYKKCDTFRLHYENHPDLIPAIKTFAKEMPEMVMKEDYQQKRHLFYTADFDSVLYKQNTEQSEINLQRPELVRMAGDKSGLWLRITEELKNKFHLTSKAYIQPYVFPYWQTGFMLKKKGLVYFTIQPDWIGADIPLCYEAAKRAVAERKALPEAFDKALNRFGCCGCRKCGGAGNAMEVFEGVNLCAFPSANFLGSGARCIHVGINNENDIDAVLRLTEENIKFK